MNLTSEQVKAIVAAVNNTRVVVSSETETIAKRVAAQNSLNQRGKNVA